MTAQTEHNPEEITIRDASRSLTKIAKTLGENPESVVRAEIDGERPLAIMSWDDYESLTETLEILGDSEAMDAIRRANAQIEAGEGRPFEDAAAELGL